jgi:UDP-glucose 4-epimerase
MPIYGDGLQTRAFSHIADVAPIIARAPLVSGTRNEVFNVGADDAYSVLDLATAIAAAFDVDPDIAHLPARTEVVHAFSDHSKMQRVFGCGAALSLEEGINRMAQWAREQGPRQQTGFDGEIEVPLNLPPSWRERIK